MNFFQAVETATEIATEINAELDFHSTLNGYHYYFKTALGTISVETWDASHIRPEAAYKLHISQDAKLAGPEMILWAELITAVAKFAARIAG